MKLKVSVFLACAASLAASVSFAAPEVETASRLRAYVRLFNAGDDELYTNAVPNAAAEAFLLENVPRFACPDPAIERAYYFRWWTYRKHLRRQKGTADGWVVTEFLPEVGWAGAENTISCPFGHHVREGRWLRDPKYLDGYIDFMLTKGRINGPRSYASWPAWSALERAKVTGDFDRLGKRLDAFTANYEAWRKGWKAISLSLRCVENRSGAKRVPFRTGYRAERGLFDFVGCSEGTEFALSHDGARPLVNAAMWAEATAISEIARRAGRADLAATYAARAADLARNIRGKLWHAGQRFFTVLSDGGVHDDVCELHGYAPFYFGMPTDGCEDAWTRLMRTDGFAAPYGLTFPARDTPGFDVSSDLSRHECLWNGPSWPYATSLALTALYVSLQAGKRLPVTAADFALLLHQYAAQHVLTLPDGRTVPWIDENLDPFTGRWIAREHMLEWKRRKMRAVPYRERGKDYNHSTFCDLVLAGLCGIVPQADGRIAVKPLAPPEWEWWCVTGVRYHGRDISVIYDRDGARFGGQPGLRVVEGR